MSDLKNINSAVIGVLLDNYLIPTTEAAALQPTAGQSYEVSHGTITNVGVVDAHVWLSVVKAGGTIAGSGQVSRRLMNFLIPVGKTLDIGGYNGFCFLNEGDYISVKADVASTLSMSLDGFNYGAPASSGVSGILTDAVGVKGHAASSSVVNGSCSVGAAADRLLLAGMVVVNAGGFAPYSTFSTLSVDCSDGSMAKLGSVDYAYSGGGATGSAHIFGRANCASKSVQALQGKAIKSGITTDLHLFSISLSGASATPGVVATDTAPTAAALNLQIASAAGHRVFMLGGFDNVTSDLMADSGGSIRDFNYFTSGVSNPHFVAFMEALGASLVKFTNSNPLLHAALAVDIAPA